MPTQDGVKKQTRKNGLVSYASRADRLSSFSSEDIAVPRGKEEEWRFTPMRRIEKLFHHENYQSNASVTVENLTEIEKGTAVLVEEVPRTDPRLGTVLRPADRTAVVAWERFDRSNVITIAKGQELDQPIIVRIEAGNEPAAQHLLIHAEEMSKATVILDHTGSAMLNQTVEVDADDGANLKVIAIQEWNRDALHASNHRIGVGRDATVEHLVVTLGGDLVRVSVDSKFKAPGGSLILNGIYFVGDNQHFEHRVFVEHSEPKCFSRVTYKGALQGKGARSVWIGDCLIGENGDGTDTYELNRNLILSEGAKADSVPNLEIENGEIEGAGHASATGRFDDEQLFYLMSRGINETEARRLVVRGFFAELLNTISDEALRERLLEHIESQLTEA